MARTTANTRTAADRILSVLRRGPKRGLTAETVSERAGTNLNTTRTTLGQLVMSSSVSIIGRETPSFGRPANLYRIADAA